MITLLVFNSAGVQIGTFSEYTDELIKETLDNSCTFEFSAPLSATNAQSYLAVGNRIGYLVDGIYKLFIISGVEDTKNNSDYIRKVSCEGLHYELLNNLVTFSYTGTNLSTIFNDAVSGSGWSVVFDGTIATPADIESNPLHAFTLETSLKALSDIASQWQCELYYTATVTSDAITGKTVHVVQKKGTVRSQVYTFSNAIDSIVKTVDYTEIVNRMYAKGAVTGSVNGIDSYVNIADKVWITPTNPVNKPLGQLYIEDSASIALYGLKQGVSEHNTDDVDYLMMTTYRDLEASKNPKISYEISLVDLYALANDANFQAKIGDTISVHDSDLSIDVTARIVELESNPNDGTATKFTLSNYQDIWDVDTLQQLKEDTAQNANPPFVNDWNSTTGETGDETIVVAKLAYKGTAGETYIGYDAKANQATALTTYKGDAKTVEIDADGNASFAGNVNGSNITIGGANNTNGTLQMKDENGNTFVTMDNTGMNGNADFTISTDNALIVKHKTLYESGSTHYTMYSKVGSDSVRLLTSQADDEYNGFGIKSLIDQNMQFEFLHKDSGLDEAVDATISLNNVANNYMMMQPSIPLRIYGNVTLANNTIWTSGNVPIVNSGTSFSPFVAGSITAGNFGYTSRVGTYWRIGPLYVVLVDIQLNAISQAAAGNLTITGLPAAPLSGVNICWITLSGVTGTTHSDISMALASPTTTITLRKGSGVYVDAYTITSTAQIRFYGMYIGA